MHYFENNAQAINSNLQINNVTKYKVVIDSCFILITRYIIINLQLKCQFKANYAKIILFL